MTHSLIVDQSVVAPVEVQDAFARTLPMPLPTLFDRWYGPIPPIRAVRGQTGAWDAAGQTRVVHLAGGATMREELTSVDPPRSFGYRLGEVTGPMAVLVDHVLGEWVFAPAAGGTEITWRWDIHPKSPRTAWALPVLGRLWKGYARRALGNLSGLLTS